MTEGRFRTAAMTQEGRWVTAVSMRDAAVARAEKAEADADRLADALDSFQSDPESVATWRRGMAALTAHDAAVAERWETVA